MVVTSVLQDQQYMSGVRSLLMVKKVLLMKSDLANVLFRQLMQQLSLSYGLTRVCQ